MLVVSVSVAGLVTLAAMTQPALAPEAKHSLLQYVTGKYLLPSNCRVHFAWDEPQLVGETMTFTVKVYGVKVFKIIYLETSVIKIKFISLSSQTVSQFIIFMTIVFHFQNVIYSFINATANRTQFVTKTI